MSRNADHNQCDVPVIRSSITVVRVPRLRDFIEEMRRDFPRVRHGEIRWQTETVTSADEHHVIYEVLTAGYIAEDDHPRLVELRLPCGRLGLSRREEDIAAQEQIASALEVVHEAARRCGLDWRPGRLSLDPSPLMPTPSEVLRSLCGTITTPEGASYAPWGHGGAIGLECRHRDGHRMLLYFDLSGETGEADGSIFVYQGASGTPAEDTALHWYDPFAPAVPMQWYTIRTANGDRQWRAVSLLDARRQHYRAFGGLRGESILRVLPPVPTPA